MLGRERRVVARHAERYTAVQELLAKGISKTTISRQLGLDRHTVHRFATATSLEEVLFKSTHRATILDAHKPYLDQRWNAGETNATVLHAELRARGFTGSVQSVRRYLHQFRGETPNPTRPDPAHARKAPSIPAPLKPRRVIRWLMTKPEHLANSDAEQLAAVLDRSPTLTVSALT